MKQKLESVQSKIKKSLEKSSNLKSPCLIAVSKKQPIEKIQNLYDLGVRDFAENYLQEALEKQKTLKDLKIRWHYIGKIQSKKIKDIVGHFDLIHTVSRVSEAQKISTIARERSLQQKILLQVNIAEEATKQGFLPSEVEEAAQVIKKLTNIELLGLMIFPPLIGSKNEAEALAWFEKAEKLFKNLQSKIGHQFLRLSMGTSSDFHLAIAKGATDVRVGESLMGPRSL